MNRYLYIVIIVSCSVLAACKKTDQDKPIVHTNGINFNLLLKTVDQYADGQSVTTYTYNNYQQLIQENSARSFTDGAKWTVNTKWFRNNKGQPDSMTSEYTYGSNPTGMKKQYYYYNNSGVLTYSILFRNANNLSASVDSCIYFYAGNSITKRLDYTFVPSSILNHTLTHEIYYKYDSLNNITSIEFVNYDFSNGIPAQKDTVTLSYGYDTMKNPFYQNEAFYAYFADLAFENYASRNNIVEIKYTGSTTANDRDEFSIQYNAVNKPDKVLAISYGIGISRPVSWSTEYYYD